MLMFDPRHTRRTPSTASRAVVSLPQRQGLTCRWVTVRGPGGKAYLEAHWTLQPSTRAS